MSSLQSLFKNTFIYGLATVLPRLLTVLLTKLLTEYLDSTTDFGEVSIIFSWIIIFNVLLTYGTETSFFRYYSEVKNKSSVLGTALITLLVSTTIFVMVAYFSIDSIALWTEKSARYWRWVIGILALDTLAVVPFAYLRARGKSASYAVVKMVNVIISVGFSALFLIALQDIPMLAAYLPDNKIELYFIAFFIASAFTFIIMLKPYFKKFSFNFTLWLKMMRYGLPVLIAGLAFAINETFDKILLEWLLPDDATAQVGIYTACYRLAVGMTLFATAFKLGVEPYFFSESQSKNASINYAIITKVFVALGSIALVAYTVLIDVIKPLLIDEAYYDAMDIVPMVLIAYLFFGIYQSLSVWYKVTDKTTYGAVISVLGAALTIALNIVLIPQLGYMASALTTCAAYGLMMVVSYLWSRSHYKIPYEMGSISLYLGLAIGFTLVHFYILRDYLGIHSIALYACGAVFLSILIGVIYKKEQSQLKLFIKGL